MDEQEFVVQHFIATRCLFAVLLTTAFCLAPALHAQDDALPPGAEPIASPPAEGVITAKKIPADEVAPLPDHPLTPALDYARKLLAQMDNNIRGYTCTLVRRERIDGRLGEYEYIAAKIRPQQGDTPLGAYLKYLGDGKFAGREILYVAGERDGNMLVRKGGPRFSYITANIPPASDAAMRSNRYPVTQIGVRQLAVRLIQQGVRELHYQECTVEYFDNAKVNGRSCLHIRVEHPQKRPHFTFHRADIYIDKQMKVPVRYTAYLWPEKPGEEPPLLEEYNYLNIRMNPGLSESDFSQDNPDYAFYKRTPGDVE